jgi:hypothetical protein
MIRKRTHKLELLAESHRSRVAELGSAGLDERTWNDLHMDDVFAAIDRTESTAPCSPPPISTSGAFTEIIAMTKCPEAQ